MVSHFAQRCEVLSCFNNRMNIRHCSALLLAVSCSFVTRAQDTGPSTVPSRLTPKQYVFLLDELESKLPLLKSHFEMLCATPGWRNENSAVRSVAGQVLAGCRKIYEDATTFLAQSIVNERVSAKLSVEFKMQRVLNDLSHTASDANNLRPYYDSRSEDTEFIMKALSPLFNTLYSHVYASISDDPSCAPKNQQKVVEQQKGAPR
jgi:hypothetical protein